MCISCVLTTFNENGDDDDDDDVRCTKQRVCNLRPLLDSADTGQRDRGQLRTTELEIYSSVLRTGHRKLEARGWR